MPTKPRKVTNEQCLRILALLESERGQWVPLPKILALFIAQYNTRIKELRGAGYDIRNFEKWIDGKKHSWYGLGVDPDSPPKGGSYR